MMKTILLAAAALLAVPAAATAQYNNQRFLLGPGTYAARAVCPPTLNLTAWPDQTASWPPLGPANRVCVNGRIGITFTVPPGPALNVLITLGDTPILSDPKVTVNRDCAEGVETTCATKHILGQLTATASGVFTYPGDVDWILLPDDHLYDTIWFTTKPKCYASGRVVIGPEGQQFLVALGGPAGCAYQITATARPAPPYDD